ncbi:hypothetical protein Cpir12675_003187 [Ceratocystis pirilliformis]|uniref:EXPERA domain-containing protein n=1 Tax=Ceratocystis pirilliformis TaxID=259994 RepID=A0ABR3Z7P9_9PEZI
MNHAYSPVLSHGSEHPRVPAEHMAFVAACRDFWRPDSRCPCWCGDGVEAGELKLEDERDAGDQLVFPILAGRQDLFAQLWKEYGLSDSRYLVSDPFMLVWGPLSLAVVAAIVLRSPLRILLTTLVSMGHLYGVVLYYSTCYVEHAFTGRSHSRPEFLYFWVYYAGCNIPWAIVPSS